MQSAVGGCESCCTLDEGLEVLIVPIHNNMAVVLHPSPETLKEVEIATLDISVREVELDSLEKGHLEVHQNVVGSKSDAQFSQLFLQECEEPVVGCPRLVGRRAYTARKLLMLNTDFNNYWYFDDQKLK